MTQPENWMTQPELTQKMRGWSPTAARTQRTPRPLVSATKFRFAWPSTDDMHTKNRSRSRSRSQISDPRSQLVLLRVGNVRAACGRRACCVWATCVLRACCVRAAACVRAACVLRDVLLRACVRGGGSGGVPPSHSPFVENGQDPKCLGGVNRRRAKPTPTPQGRGNQTEIRWKSD